MLFDFARTALVLLAVSGGTFAAPRTLLTKPLHLGVAGAPEWEEFAPDKNPLARIDLTFDAEPNASEATLFIRQRDVKQEWIVELNNRRLGKLLLMETALVQQLSVPPAVLKEHGNTLAIFRAGSGIPDDIIIEEVSLDTRAPSDSTALATLTIDVSDEQGAALPCRVTIVDNHGSLAAIWDAREKDDPAPLTHAIRPGVVYTARGRVRIAVQPGEATVVASRGFEWSIARHTVTVGAGDSASISLRLRREVSTPNLVACDTHIHTLTFSGHGDATIDERMLTIAGEGIELPIATDHNAHIDYREAIRRVGIQRWFTPVIGNEVTTRTGHFNIFPVEPNAPVVDADLVEWPRLLDAMRHTPGVRIIVLNHPRSIHSGFRPFDPTNFNAASGESLKTLAFTFDALEVLNSGAQQTDFMRVYRDWFALLNRGHRIITIGASDSHDVSRFIVGQGRTYIAAADNDPAHIDVEEACRNLRAGHALVSMGLLATMTVDGAFSVGDLVTDDEPELRVEVDVRGPEWVDGPTHVALFANGTIIRETEFALTAPGDERSAGGLKGHASWRLPRPSHDIYLVAIATAPAVNEPFWAMTKPYQPNSIQWQGRAIGSTNPIWVDGDADGKFSSAHAYAERVVTSHAQSRSSAALLRALADYDEATAIQAASICRARSIDSTEPDFAAELARAAPQVKSGFAKFRDAAQP